MTPSQASASLRSYLLLGAFATLLPSQIVDGVPTGCRPCGADEEGWGCLRLSSLWSF